MKDVKTAHGRKGLAKEETLDELNEFLEDSEYVPMSIPILK